jgi:hypothetical protein
MGMFDYIRVGTTLPELPDAIISHWGDKVSDIAFQTKDTPNQAMSTYRIDGNGQLWFKKVEGHWDEGKKVADDAPFSEKIAAMGHFVVDAEWYEKECFSGNICFYESYSHPEYHELDDHAGNSDDWMRFVRGWIEYSALFKDGKLVGDIELVKHEEPQKLSDEELAESKSKVAAQRKEMEERFRENRQKYPTAEQKLIDNIDRETKLAYAIFDEEDLSNALSNIRILIEEYRKKHDRWYEETK